MSKLLALAMAFAFLPPVPALAEEDFTEINFVFGVEPRQVSDRAFDLFSGDDWVTAGSLAAELEFMPNMFVQVGVDSFTNSEELLSSYKAQLNVIEPHVTARGGYTLFDGLRAYASLGVTYTLADVVIELSPPHKLATNVGIFDGSFGARAALGIELFTPRKIFGIRSGLWKDFTIGVSIEGGYAYRTSVSLDGLKQGKKGDLEESPDMKPGELDLGELDMSGAFIAVDGRIYF